jgi:lipopolysaccharide export LptBFGC system permease protein LptF
VNIVDKYILKKFLGTFVFMMLIIMSIAVIFDVTEKIEIVLGMFIFGILISLTGSMQYSVLSLVAFFALSFLVLSKVKITDFIK